MVLEENIGALFIIRKGHNTPISFFPFDRNISLNIPYFEVYYSMDSRINYTQKLLTANIFFSLEIKYLTNDKSTTTKSKKLPPNIL